MKFYPNQIVQKIREERKTGISLRKLQNKYKIPDTTISRWTYDILVGNKKQLNSRRSEQEFKGKNKKVVDGFKINSDKAKILASLLYWCEGAKYPVNKFIGFANSNTVLIKMFLGLLRQGFKLDESKFRIQLQLHTTHNENKMIKFWSDWLGIPKNKFHKSTITSPTNKRKRRDYRGTCTLKYYDVKLLWQIMGIYESFSSKWRGTQVAEGGSLLNS